MFMYIYKYYICISFSISSYMWFDFYYLGRLFLRILTSPPVPVKSEDYIKFKKLSS